MENMGKVHCITFHWTAGNYDQTFPDYHFCIKGDGRVVQVRSLSLKGAHTWMRNTGNVGISFCGMAKNCPIKPIQVEAGAKLAAELCLKAGLDPDGEYTAPVLVLKDGQLCVTGKTFQAPVVADHAYYAHKDGYFPDRWDIGELMDDVRRKIPWYYQNLKEKKIRPEYTLKLK